MIFNEEKVLKRYLKRKFKITEALVVAFLVTGSISYSLSVTGTESQVIINTSGEAITISPTGTIDGTESLFFSDFLDYVSGNGVIGEASIDGITIENEGRIIGKISGIPTFSNTTVNSLGLGNAVFNKDLDSDNITIVNNTGDISGKADLIGAISVSDDVGMDIEYSGNGALANVENNDGSISGSVEATTRVGNNIEIDVDRSANGVIGDVTTNNGIISGDLMVKGGSTSQDGATDVYIKIEDSGNGVFGDVEANLGDECSNKGITGKVLAIGGTSNNTYSNVDARIIGEKVGNGVYGDVGINETHITGEVDVRGANVDDANVADAKITLDRSGNGVFGDVTTNNGIIIGEVLATGAVTETISGKTSSAIRIDMSGNGVFGDVGDNNGDISGSLTAYGGTATAPDNKLATSNIRVTKSANGVYGSVGDNTANISGKATLIGGFSTGEEAKARIRIGNPDNGEDDGSPKGVANGIYGGVGDNSGDISGEVFAGGGFAQSLDMEANANIEVFFSGNGILGEVAGNTTTNTITIGDNSGNITGNIMSSGGIASSSDGGDSTSYVEIDETGNGILGNNKDDRFANTIIEIGDNSGKIAGKGLISGGQSYSVEDGYSNASVDVDDTANGIFGTDNDYSLGDQIIDLTIGDNSGEISGNLQVSGGYAEGTDADSNLDVTDSGNGIFGNDGDTGSDDITTATITIGDNSGEISGYAKITGGEALGESAKAHIDVYDSANGIYANDSDSETTGSSIGIEIGDNLADGVIKGEIEIVSGVANSEYYSDTDIDAYHSGNGIYANESNNDGSTTIEVGDNYGIISGSAKITGSTSANAIAGNVDTDITGQHLGNGIIGNEGYYESQEIDVTIGDNSGNISGNIEVIGSVANADTLADVNVDIEFSGNGILANDSPLDDGGSLNIEIGDNSGSITATGNITGGEANSANNNAIADVEYLYSGNGILGNIPDDNDGSVGISSISIASTSGNSVVIGDNTSTGAIATNNNIVGGTANIAKIDDDDSAQAYARVYIENSSNGIVGNIIYEEDSPVDYISIGNNEGTISTNLNVTGGAITASGSDNGTEFTAEIKSETFIANSNNGIVGSIADRDGSLEINIGNSSGGIATNTSVIGSSTDIVTTNNSISYDIDAYVGINNSSNGIVGNIGEINNGSTSITIGNISGNGITATLDVEGSYVNLDSDDNLSLDGSTYVNSNIDIDASNNGILGNIGEGDSIDVTIGDNSGSIVATTNIDGSTTNIDVYNNSSINSSIYTNDTGNGILGSNSGDGATDITVEIGDNSGGIAAFANINGSNITDSTTNNAYSPYIQGEISVYNSFNGVLGNDGSADDGSIIVTIGDNSGGIAAISNINGAIIDTTTKDSIGSNSQYVNIYLDNSNNAIFGNDSSDGATDITVEIGDNSGGITAQTNIMGGMIDSDDDNSSYRGANIGLRDSSNGILGNTGYSDGGTNITVDIGDNSGGILVLGNITGGAIEAIDGQAGASIYSDNSFNGIIGNSSDGGTDVTIDIGDNSGAIVADLDVVGGTVNTDDYAIADLGIYDSVNGQLGTVGGGDGNTVVTMGENSNIISADLDISGGEADSIDGFAGATIGVYSSANGRFGANDISNGLNYITIGDNTTTASAIIASIDIEGGEAYSEDSYSDADTYVQDSGNGIIGASMYGDGSTDINISIGDNDGIISGSVDIIGGIAEADINSSADAFTDIENSGNGIIGAATQYGFGGFGVASLPTTPDGISVEIGDNYGSISGSSVIENSSASGEDADTNIYSFASGNGVVGGIDYLDGGTIVDHTIGYNYGDISGNAEYTSGVSEANYRATSNIVSLASGNGVIGNIEGNAGSITGNAIFTAEEATVTTGLDGEGFASASIQDDDILLASILTNMSGNGNGVLGKITENTTDASITGNVEAYGGLATADNIDGSGEAYAYALDFFGGNGIQGAELGIDGPFPYIDYNYLETNDGNIIGNAEVYGGNAIADDAMAASTTLVSGNGAVSKVGENSGNIIGSVTSIGGTTTGNSIGSDDTFESYVLGSSAGSFASGNGVLGEIVFEEDGYAVEDNSGNIIGEAYVEGGSAYADQDEEALAFAYASRSGNGVVGNVGTNELEGDIVGYAELLGGEATGETAVASVISSPNFVESSSILGVGIMHDDDDDDDEPVPLNVLDQNGNGIIGDIDYNHGQVAGEFYGIAGTANAIGNDAGAYASVEQVESGNGTLGSAKEENSGIISGYGYAEGGLAIANSTDDDSMVDTHIDLDTVGNGIATSRSVATKLNTGIITGEVEAIGGEGYAFTQNGSDGATAIADSSIFIDNSGNGATGHIVDNIGEVHGEVLAKGGLSAAVLTDAYFSDIKADSNIEVVDSGNGIDGDVATNSGIITGDGDIYRGFAGTYNNDTEPDSNEANIEVDIESSANGVKGNAYENSGLIAGSLTIEDQVIDSVNGAVASEVLTYGTSPLLYALDGIAIANTDIDDSANGVDEGYVFENTGVILGHADIKGADAKAGQVEGDVDIQDSANGVRGNVEENNGLIIGSLLAEGGTVFGVNGLADSSIESDNTANGVYGLLEENNGVIVGFASIAGGEANSLEPTIIADGATILTIGEDVEGGAKSYINLNDTANGLYANASGGLDNSGLMAGFVYSEGGEANGYEEAVAAAYTIIDESGNGIYSPNSSEKVFEVGENTGILYGSVYAEGGAATSTTGDAFAYVEIEDSGNGAHVDTVEENYGIMSGNAELYGGIATSTNGDSYAFTYANDSANGLHGDLEENYGSSIGQAELNQGVANTDDAVSLAYSANGVYGDVDDNFGLISGQATANGMMITNSGFGIMDYQEDGFERIEASANGIYGDLGTNYGTIVGRFNSDIPIIPVEDPANETGAQYFGNGVAIDGGIDVFENDGLIVGSQAAVVASSACNATNLGVMVGQVIYGTGQINPDGTPIAQDVDLELNRGIKVYTDELGNIEEIDAAVSYGDIINTTDSGEADPSDAWQTFTSSDDLAGKTINGVGIESGTVTINDGEEVEIDNDDDEMTIINAYGTAVTLEDDSALIGNNIIINGGQLPDTDFNGVIGIMHTPEDIADDDSASVSIADSELELSGLSIINGDIHLHDDDEAISNILTLSDESIVNGDIHAEEGEIALEDDVIMNGDISIDIGTLTIDSDVILNGDLTGGDEMLIASQSFNIMNGEVVEEYATSLQLGNEDGNLDIVHDINNFGQIDIEGEVNFTTNSHITGAPKVDVAMNSNMLIDINSMEKDDDDRVTGHALYGSNTYISTEEGTVDGIEADTDAGMVTFNANGMGIGGIIAMSDDEGNQVEFDDEAYVRTNSLLHKAEIVDGEDFNIESEDDEARDGDIRIAVEQDFYQVIGSIIEPGDDPDDPSDPDDSEPEAPRSPEVEDALNNLDKLRLIYDSLISSGDGNINAIAPTITLSDSSQTNEINTFGIMANEISIAVTPEELAAEELLALLDCIYAKSPYGYTIHASKDAMSLMNTKVIDPSFNPKANEWLIYGGATYNNLDFDGNLDIPVANVTNADIDSDISGGYTYAEYGLNNKTSAGFVFGAMHTNAEGNLSDADGNSFYVGAYGKTQVGNFKLKLGAAYQFTHFDTYRIACNNLQAFTYSDTVDTHGITTYADATYSYELRDGFFLEPNATISFYSINQEAIDEGNSDLAIEVDDETVNYVDGEAGLDISKVITNSLGKYKFTAGVSYLYTFTGDDEEYLTGNFKGGTDFDILIPEKDEGRARADLSVEAELNNGFIYNLGGGYTTGDETDEFYIGVGVGYKFNFGQ